MRIDRRTFLLGLCAAPALATPLLPAPAAPLQPPLEPGRARLYRTHQASGRRPDRVRWLMGTEVSEYEARRSGRALHETPLASYYVVDGECVNVTISMDEDVGDFSYDTTYLRLQDVADLGGMAIAVERVHGTMVKYATRPPHVVGNRQRLTIPLLLVAAERRISLL